MNDMDTNMEDAGAGDGAGAMPRVCLSGLPNLGATCGINSLLQAIYHTGALRELLVGASMGPTAAEGLAGRVQGLFRTIQEGNLAWKTAIGAMRGLVRTLYQRAGLNPWEQQDVTELWTYLADRLAEEMFDPQGFHAYPAPSVEEDAGLAALCQRATEEARRFNRTSAGPWLDRIQGFYIQQVHCQAGGCGYVTHGFQPATCLSLEPRGSIADALMQYFSFEDLHDSWKCDRCHTQGRADRVSRFWDSPPSVLVLSLKRFHYGEDGTAKKIHDPCTIPLQLEIGRGLVIGSRGAKRGYAYQLSAVVQHHGNIHGGHYTCMVCVPMAQGGIAWACVDDHTIHIVQDIAAVLQDNQNGYLLFYERVQGEA